MSILLLATPYTYNAQAASGVVIVNLLILIWIGLVWSGILNNSAARRVLLVGSFLILAVVMAHAIIMPAIAR